MVEYILEFSKKWVLSHRDDAVLPCGVFKKKLVERFGADLVFALEGVYTLAFKIDEDKHPLETVLSEISTITRANYNEEPDRMYRLRFGENVISMKPLSNSRFIFDEDENDEGADAAEATEVKQEAKKTPIQRLQEELAEVPGCKEFRELIDEAITMAPLMSDKRSNDIFLNQSYLFSINDGYGLETYMNYLNRAIGELGISKVQSYGNFKFVAPSEKGEGKEIFNDALEAVRFNPGSSLAIICIDISNFIKDTNTVRFKYFLSELAKENKGKIYIFRIPYVDKEVLERVSTSLNDILYVRSVSFPPLNMSELRKIGEASLKLRGFTMSEEAWYTFDQRIAEEKRDGKFYGIDTVEKVCREMIYKKLLYDARNGLSSDIITPAEIDGLVSIPEIDGKSGFELLDSMVGTEYLKNKIMEVISQIELSRKDKSLGNPCIHMRFVGNPGTGKTTVARIIGKILKEKGVLRIGNFYEYSGRDFVGRFIGETAPKVSGMCRDAYGSVMFIDEAYSLYVDNSPRDFGKEALDTLIAEMENHRDDFVVIMAGYTDEMDTLMKGNAGLKSRIPYTVEFPNFTREQLHEIFVSMVGTKVPCDSSVFDASKDYFLGLTDSYLNSKEFSNARFVRNLFERVCGKAALRCQLHNEELRLTKDDFDRAIKDSEFNLLEKKKGNRIGF